MEPKFSSYVSTLLECSVECEKAYQACLNSGQADQMMLCIKMTRDCADICRLTSSFIIRNTLLEREIVSLCMKCCEMCLQECNNYTYLEPCKKCVEICKKCMDACMAMA